MYRKTLTIAALIGLTITSHAEFVAFLGKYEGNGSPIFQQEVVTQFSPNSKNFVELGGGYYHSVGIDSLGQLWATGSNFKGQLGHRDYDTIDNIFMMEIDNIKKVSRNGQLHTLILKNNGLMYGTGFNSVGQLGTGDTLNRDSWTHIDIKYQGSSIKFVDVYGGNGHSLAIDAEGYLWATGKNEKGQLGIGSNSNINKWQRVDGLSNIVQASAGEFHSIALDSDGNVWTTGGNVYGELGQNDFTNRNVFTKVQDLTDIVEIEAGENHSTALDIHGKVFTVGFNQYGQSGNGDNSITKLNSWYEVPNLSNIVSIEGGLYHTLALDNVGNLWATGRNHKGQLGTGDTTNRDQFVIVAGNVKKIRAGAFFTTVIDDVGDIYSVGHNNGGQLGINNYDDKSSWTKIPFIEATIIY